MSVNRNLPFGYQFENGKIQINAIEATLIREIFNSYIGGKSYQTIASDLSAGPISYKNDTHKWNKHMIKRILENPKYFGEQAYPTIISQETFEAVAKMIKSKFQAKTICPALPQIRKRLRCGECGAVITRERLNARYENWQCKVEGKIAKKRITDEMILGGVIKGLDRIIENPNLIALPMGNVVEPSLEITKLSNRINRELEKKLIDEDVAKDLIKQLATARYDNCIDREPERITENLERLLKTEESNGEFNAPLFNMAIKEIRLHKEGNMDFMLMSGKLLIGINR